METESQGGRPPEGKGAAVRKDRAAIAEMTGRGMKAVAIYRALKCTYSYQTVLKWLHRCEEGKPLTDRPRSGRLPKYGPEVKQQIRDFVQNNPDLSLTAYRKQIGETIPGVENIGRETIRRIIAEKKAPLKTV